jgi:hypothetical protein
MYCTTAFGIYGLHHDAYAGFVGRLFDAAARRATRRQGKAALNMLAAFVHELKTIRS